MAHPQRQIGTSAEVDLVFDLLMSAWAGGKAMPSINDVQGKGLKLKLSLHRTNLTKRDMTVPRSSKKIRSAGDFFSYLFAIRKLLDAGGKRNTQRAELFMLLCLIHPAFGTLAREVSARLVDEDGMIR